VQEEMAQTAPCKLVGRVGIEPTTNGLKVQCSTD
jgi:hypothetical protein